MLTFICLFFFLNVYVYVYYKVHATCKISGTNPVQIFAVIEWAKIV